MARGGARPGAGKPKGAINKKSAARAAAAKASGMMPHEFLLAVAQGKTIDGYKPTFEDRMKCARDAAPYYASKLASVALHGANEDGSFTFNVNLAGSDARA